MNVSSLQNTTGHNDASFLIPYQEMPDNLRQLGKNQSQCASGGLSPSWDDVIDDENKWVCTAQVEDYVFSCCEAWLGETRKGCNTAQCLIAQPTRKEIGGVRTISVFQMCLQRMAAANNDARNKTECSRARDINKSLGKSPPGQQTAPKNSAPTTAAAPKAALAVLLLVGSAVAFC